jgi:uncharacterized membrane protein
MEIAEHLHWLHIVSGFTAFLVAPIALVTQKGSRVHRFWGKVYFWTLSLVASTAVLMSVINTNHFLMMVAVFSFYLAFSGYRSTFRKALWRKKKVSWIDWTGAMCAMAFGAGLIFYGLIAMVSDAGQSLAYVSVIFGVIGVALAIGDLRLFNSPPNDKHRWMFDHMIGMCASYIATVSAFSVVNLTFLPVLVQWLWPSLIGTPLLIFWVRSYKKRFMKGNKIEDEVVLRILNRKVKR